MAFTVDDFQDLLRLLEARPEWRAQLRRLLIPDDVLELPALVARLAEAQVRAEERLSGVEERLSGVEERLSGVEERLSGVEERLIRLENAVIRLAEAQERTEARVDRLEAGQARLEAGQARLEDGYGRLEAGYARLEAALAWTDTKVAELRGDSLERRYRDHVGGYFGRLVRRARVVGSDELDDLLDEGLVAGVLDEDGAHDVRLADLVVRGRRPGDEQETYLVVEVSGLIEPADVERAARRAALLGRVRPALAVVGGEDITADALDLAQVRTVRRLGNGRLDPA